MDWVNMIMPSLVFAYLFAGAFHAGRNYNGDISDMSLWWYIKIVFGWLYYYVKGDIK